MIAQSRRMDLVKNLDDGFFESRRPVEIKSSYSSGEITRMAPAPRGIDPLGSDADYHYRSEHNYFLHVERGRAAVRNHPLVEQGINRLIANLRLDGFALDVNSGDTQLDKDLQDAWKGWAGETIAGRNECDYEGTRSFQQIARQSFFSRCSDGDIVHLPLSNGQIQTWESHHIRSPFGIKGRFSNSDQDGIVHGAEVKNGKTVAYWITPHNVPFYGSLKRKGQARRYPVFDSEGNKITFWLGFRHRFFQRRGISRLSAPRDAMTGFDDLNYANIMSSKRRALIAYLMEDNPGAMQSQLPGSGGNQKIPQSGDRYSTDVGLGLQTITVEQMGEPAQVIKAPEGKTLTGWNANLPSPAFFEHASLMLTMLAVNLDLPLSFLLLDGSLVNFHGGRMTFEQVKLRLTQLQKDEIRGLWAPTFEWWLRSRLTPGSALFDASTAAAVAKGADPFSYVFRPRGWAYVKPAEDAAAEDLAERRNLRSLRQILSDRGVDINEHIPEVLSDRASWVRFSIAVARKIATQNSDLDIDVLTLASELRYGQKIAEEEVKSQASQIATDNNNAAAVTK